MNTRTKIKKPPGSRPERQLNGEGCEPSVTGGTSTLVCSIPPQDRHGFQIIAFDDGSIALRQIVDREAITISLWPDEAEVLADRLPDAILAADKDAESVSRISLLHFSSTLIISLRARANSHRTMLAATFDCSVFNGLVAAFPVIRPSWNALLAARCQPTCWQNSLTAKMPDSKKSAKNKPSGGRKAVKAD